MCYLSRSVECGCFKHTLRSVISEDVAETPCIGGQWTGILPLRTEFSDMLGLFPGVHNSAIIENLPRDVNSTCLKKRITLVGPRTMV